MVVMATQEYEVGEDGGSSVGPVDDVVGVEVAGGVAAREPARVVVSPFERKA